MPDTTSTRQSLLVRLLDPRDQAAWVEFVEIYEPLIQRLARSRGLQGADADDLAQDVFRAVAGAIDRWDPDPARGSFRGWLFRIARNLIVNLLAARRRQPRAVGGSDLVSLLESVPSTEAEDTVLFDGEYRRRLFDWAAARIRPEFREHTWQAFWRTGVDGEDVAAVARSLDLTSGAVYVARSRVMARLRREIEQVGGQDES
jgi:RNA polymerase sigma factor (sigma-70 family)